MGTARDCGSGRRGDVMTLTVVRVVVAAVGTARDCGSGISENEGVAVRRRW